MEQATKNQLEYLGKLLEEAGYDERSYIEIYTDDEKHILEELSKREASQMIDDLKKELGLE